MCSLSTFALRAGRWWVDDVAKTLCGGPEGAASTPPRHTQSGARVSIASDTLVLFGYAISFDVDDISLAVLDQARSSDSRAVVEALASSGYFRVERYLDDPGQLEDAIDRGDVQVAIHIPPGYSGAVSAGQGSFRPLSTVVTRTQPR